MQWASSIAPFQPLSYSADKEEAKRINPLVTRLASRAEYWIGARGKAYAKLALTVIDVRGFDKQQSLIR
ncbi:hypothetical protein [Undibacterium flavidum]|uniref:Uncharacterized protein n=1 Tax=Undibacterium flavidum TaxID=2762297 RepID=A0ABR6YEC8_9BURK|nr:hypothetical protein [Undibacterium flavidum]MBC3874914.1 hypothetical protein [Undibacterium flavidum]